MDLLKVISSMFWKQDSVIHEANRGTPRDLTGSGDKCLASFVEKFQLILSHFYATWFLSALNLAKPNNCHQQLEWNISKWLEF